MDDSPRIPIEHDIAAALNGAARSSGPTPAGLCGHDLHVYRTEAHLTKSVVRFLADGLAAGQPIVVIATEAHQRAFRRGLGDLGLDVDEVFSGREALWLDARETLAAFMEGPTPNRELFVKTVGAVFERIIERRHYLVVRAYGEMVDLLWKEGNTEGAILVERLWNELAMKYSFGLLCAYSLENFLNDPSSDRFRRVCAYHTRTLPLEPTLPPS